MTGFVLQGHIYKKMLISTSLNALNHSSAVFSNLHDYLFHAWSDCSKGGFFLADSEAGLAHLFTWQFYVVNIVKAKLYDIE